MAGNKNSGNRPKQNPHESRLTVLLTPHERMLWDAAARGEPTSTWVRRTINRMIGMEMQRETETAN